MGNSNSILLLSAAVALITFFLLSPILMMTIANFGVRKNFAETMVKEGVVPESEVKMRHPKQQGISLVITIVLIAVLLAGAVKTAPWGYFCIALPLLGGIMRYRNLIQFNNLTVKWFRNQYKDVLNAKKFNRYVDEHF